MIKIRTYYRCQVTYYSKEVFIASCFHHGIDIYDFVIHDHYNFEFIISKKDYKKLKNYYLELKIVKKYGFESFLNFAWINKFTFALLILSISLYSFLGTRIYSVKINGTSDSINDYISKRLDELDIGRLSKMPSSDELKQVEDILKMELLEQLELISINSKGTYIFVNYEKKGDIVEIEQKHGKMYAKKEGIIKSFDIESGKIVKEINDYVNVGDLLVDDTILYKDKAIVVGTLGRVMAYTFNNITVSCSSKGLEKAEVYQLLLSKARYEVSKNFDRYSYIDKEIIMSYINQNDVANMTIHYTLVENIAKF